MSRPDLDRARKYLEPSGWERSPLSRISWHAWPAAILIALIALVCYVMTGSPAGEGFAFYINLMQNTDDVPKVARTVAVFAGLHIIVNFAALLFDQTRPFPARLVDALSTGVSGIVLWLCIQAMILFRTP